MLRKQLCRWRRCGRPRRPSKVEGREGEAKARGWAVISNPHNTMSQWKKCLKMLGGPDYTTAGGAILRIGIVMRLSTFMY